MSNKKVEFEPLVQIREESYGTSDSWRPEDDEEIDDEEDDLENSFLRLRSSLDDDTRRVLTSVRATNIMTSSRSIADHLNLEVVPTKLKKNVALVLSETTRGRFYIDIQALYRPTQEVKYALTLRSDIYQRVCGEINDSRSVPCGLYFCCHGGDGAHAGVSHDDHVDISLAYCIVGFVFGTMLYLSWVLPSVDDTGLFNE